MTDQGPIHVQGGGAPPPRMAAVEIEANFKLVIARRDVVGGLDLVAFCVRQVVCKSMEGVRG